MVGCPNFCHGDEVLERRRAEEQERVLREEAEKQEQDRLEQKKIEQEAEAKKRTDECEDLTRLRASQINQRDRLLAFERKMKWLMWTRHGQQKVELLSKHAELEQKMKDRVCLWLLLFRFYLFIYLFYLCWRIGIVI